MRPTINKTTKQDKQQKQIILITAKTQCLFKKAVSNKVEIASDET